MRLLQRLEHPNIIRYLDSFLLAPRDDDDGGGGKAGGEGQGQGAQQHHGNELVIVVEWAAAGDLRRQLRKAAEVSQQVRFRFIHSDWGALGRPRATLDGFDDTLKKLRHLSSSHPSL